MREPGVVPDDPQDALLAQLGEIHAAAQIAADRVEVHVVPVFGYTEAGDVDLEGSGVIGRLDDAYYLVTAAHVLRACPHGVGIPIGNEVRPPQSSSLLIGRGGRPGTSRDRVDLGFIRLHPSEVAEIGEDRFLDLADNHAPPMRIETTFFIAIGYPVRDFRAGRPGDPISAVATVFYTGAAEGRGYQWAGVDYESHFLIRYRRQDIATAKSVGAPPGFRGMSGGGVWPFDVLREPGPANPPCFGGLLIERPAGFASAFLVTRGSLVEGCIRHFEPALDEGVIEP